MKKITLLMAAMLLSLFTYSQQTISFESAEGFSLGDINTQNGWVTTGTPDGSIVNQLISDEQASDGTFSLKTVNEPAFGRQNQPLVGAFYTYAAPVSNTSATFSADMYIDTFDGVNTANYGFALVNLTAGVFVTYVSFNLDGGIFVLVDDGTGTNTITLDDTTADWTPLTWFNVRMEITNDMVEVFIDNVSIYNGLLASASEIEQVRLAHDNGTGFAYYDNFRTNDEDLSVADYTVDSFSHYYNVESNTLNLNSPSSLLNSVEIFDVLGKRVLNNGLFGNEDSVNVTSFKDGIYLARITTETGVKTVKFVKS